LLSFCEKDRAIDGGRLSKTSSIEMMHFKATCRSYGSAAWLLLLALTAPMCVSAQNSVVKSPQAAVSVQSQSATWASLSPAQQSALAPLSKSWESLSEGQKRKWTAIAKSYPGLAAADQEKMHSRMVDWAALSPKDREFARLNFAQTKTVSKSDRAAEWENYQALSPEEKKKLAASGATKPVGAAVAPKPVPSDKLAAVPVTRHTPEEQRNALKSPPAAPVKKTDVNSNTPASESASQPKS
jgi:hypothetical protein